MRPLLVPSRTFSAAVLLALAVPVAAQAPLFLHDGNLVPGARVRDAETALALLFSGAPAGLATAIPNGARLVATRRSGTELTVVVSSGFVRHGPGLALEAAIEQLDKTGLSDPTVLGVRLLVADDQGREVSLREALGEDRAALPTQRTPQLGPTSAPFALAGKTIAVSPGHGWYWSATLAAWTTQRGAIDGLTEDFHTNEIAMDWLIPALENMGARVVSCRERSRQLAEVFGDNDTGAPSYVEGGAWSTGASNGWNLKTYRYATTAATPTATATWKVAVPQDGVYPVSVFFESGTNRVPDARFTITHTAGSTTLLVDQTVDDRAWIWLGNFAFTAAQGATIVLDNQSAQVGKVVIADAVRVGAGLGTLVRGPSTSGKPKWQECSRVWAQTSGLPSSVWSRGTGSDDGDDVTTRPALAEWYGADCFVSLHTNAGGGAGTETFVYNGTPTAGSVALQTAVQTRLVADIRAEYEPTWVDRGLKSANFGEVRVLSTMPGILCELAFHDTVGSIDHKALHDPRFRRIAGRAYARGVLRYFFPAAAFAPEAPTALRVTQDGANGLRVAWDGTPGATLYAVESSFDGKGFAEVAQTAATTWSTGPLPFGRVMSFRVRAINATGRSFPTEVLCAGTSHLGTGEVLLVQGFDRFDRSVKEPENTQDYLRLHGDAIARSGAFSLGFDAASNEAVKLGRVALAGYRAVDWALGEESTVHETFDSQEQALVTAYLQQGGRLLVTGAELGWDLQANGSTADKAFLNSVLGVAYVADDAGTYNFTAGTGVLLGAPAGAFDNGTGGTYNVDYPDVLAPYDAKSALCLTYLGGAGAGIARTDGNARVLTLGFPLETITNATTRAELMARALRFLLSPATLDCAPTFGIGTTLPITVSVPGDAGLPFVLGAALAPGAIPLPGGRVLALAADGILELSLTAANGVFVGFQGVLDAQGSASAAFVVPPLPILLGVSFYFSGFTVQSFAPPLEKSTLRWIRSTGK